MSRGWNGNGFGEAPPRANQRTIPFDYTFEFTLEGEPGNVVRHTQAVSIEGAFAAVSIGYGLIPRVSSIVFGPDDQALSAFGRVATPKTIRDMSLDFILDTLESQQARLRADLQDLPFLRTEAGPEAILKQGIRLNPEFVELALDGDIISLPSSLRGQLFQTVAAPPENIQFRYAIFDDGTGRAFQSDPILSIAGLGIADGDRPFRTFTPPIVFGPRATIRIEVMEISEFAGDLSIVLHGFKQLGEAGTPTSPRRVRRRR